MSREDAGRMLKRAVEKDTLDPGLVRKSLLSMVGESCYQSGNVEKILEYSDFCQYVAERMRRIYSLFRSIQDYPQDGLEEELFFTFDSRSDMVWVKTLFNGRIDDLEVGKGSVIRLPIAKAYYLMKTGLVSPLSIRRAIYISEK